MEQEEKEVMGITKGVTVCGQQGGWVLLTFMLYNTVKYIKAKAKSNEYVTSRLHQVPEIL